MNSQLPFRQIHLDFHTSPHIPGIAADFDAGEFIDTLRDGRVNSITVFARCHHGYCYYPTQVGTPHPHLERPDLLGEMVAACRAAGIRVGGYTTVTWDELAWETHPEWRHITPAGGIGGPAGSPLQPGWKNMCMNTGYADYVLAQIAEMVDGYEIDEVFIDIVRYIGQPCVCAVCLQQMREQGVDPEDEHQLQRFALKAERGFMQRATETIHSRKPGMGIFYNSRLVMEWDPELSNHPEMDDFTHLEIESLPGGFWGYDHFPLFVRYFQSFERELVAMTGRFHTMWGDFGGLRNRAALEFESFQALAHGAGVSIGDQLHPRGRLDKAVYRRIGEVYAEVERREPWCVNTEPLPEIGVITASGQRGVRGASMPAPDIGALHILEQLKHQFAFLDAGSDLSSYAVIILPDEVYVDEELAQQLRAYLQDGGKLLISGRSGLDEARGEYLLAAEMGAQYAGPAEFAPDYLVLAESLTSNIEPMQHVCELPGVKLTAASGAQVLARSAVPYFNRAWQHFCSHQYTPMERETDDPVIIQHGNVLTIARPLFTEYAESARRVHKQVIANCLERLLPQPRIGAHNLPSTAVVTLRRQQRDLIVHILHYVHQRRGQILDIIEDVLPLHNVTLAVRTAESPTDARLVPEDQPVDWSWQDGYTHLHIPRVDGYQIIQLRGVE